MEVMKIAKGVLRSKILKKPFYVHLFVTRRCNFKCKMCSVWKIKGEREMNFGEMIVAAQKLKKLGVTIVTLTGGEPLLRKDILGIVHTFSQLGIMTRLQTNGSLLTEKKLDELIAAGVNDISVSLDTLDNKEQKNICRTKIDVTNTAIKALKMIVRKMPKSMTTANVVVSHKNLLELPSMIRFLDSIGVWFNFTLVNTTTKDTLFRAKSKGFKFTDGSKAEARRVFNDIIDMKKKGYMILPSMKLLNQTIECIETGNERWDCHAGVDYFSIFPDGNFALCDEVTPWIADNILDSWFIPELRKKVWKSMAKKIRDTSCKGCFFSCWRETDNLIHSWGALDALITLFRVKKRKWLERKH